MQQTKEPKDTKDAKDSKIRVFALAKELNLETKVLLEYCKDLGFAGIKNQLNALEPEQVDALKDRVKKGPKASAPAAAPPKPLPPSVPPKLDTKIPTLAKPKPLPPAPPKPASAPVAPPAAVAPAAPVAPKPPVVAAPKPVEAPAAVVAPPAPAPKPAPAPVVEAPRVPKVEAAPTVAAPEPAPVVVAAPAPVPTPEVKPEPVAPAVPAVVAEAAPTPQPTPAAPTPVVPATQARMPNLTSRPPQPFGSNRPANLTGNRPASIPPVRPPAPTPQVPAASALPRPPISGPTPPPAPASSNPAASNPAGAPPRPPGPSPYPPPRPGPSTVAPGGFSRGPNPPSYSTGPRPTGPGGMPPRHGPAGGGAQRAGGLPPRSGGGPSGPRPPVGPGTGGPRPAAGAAPKGTIKLTPEQIQRLRDTERLRGKQTFAQIQQIVTAPPPGEKTDANRGPVAPGVGTGRAPGKTDGPEDAEGDRRGGGAGARKPGEVAGRDGRHKARQVGRQRTPSTNSIIVGQGGRVDMIDYSMGSRIKKHRGKQHVAKKPASIIGGKVEIALPISVRSLSEAIGVKANELILKLKQLTSQLFTINANVEFEVAELIATEKNIELVAKKSSDVEGKTLQDLKDRREAKGDEHLIARPPIVTIMGHVDHGKTSLLDKIRQEYGLTSDVVSTEAGGITQVIRAWRVQKGDKSTTFLDTPGHEAFTKMRARGANVTDVAVIVVSATDGIMPQTQEAVSHAKAADVDIIIAINKCDLPGANPEKIKNQLYSLELVPEDMGGDVPVVLTSAVTGQGVGELLDKIALLAELADPPLRADPDHAATGTCLEGYLSGDEGVTATLIVQNGTLRKGDVLLCGSTFGRVRAMYDDQGKQIKEAGPSTPVRITGLDDVPDADDPFYVVADVSTAREIAEKRSARRREADRFKFMPKSLDSIKEANSKVKVAELKVVLKAEARGSIEAIKKEMEKLVHDEVRVRVLHAGIGAITESDVNLALTSPDDTLVIGFNVTADDAALRLAGQRDITIHEYDIIYKLTDEVKQALEGKLKPSEEVVHLGRAVVRETFKVGKVGVIAGCYVTSGTLERSARVRVIREGVVLFPSSDKSVGLDSLRRFKDDAKEVREGFECGLKITGFNDIKVGDVIEAFKIEIRQRTL